MKAPLIMNIFIIPQHWEYEKDINRLRHKKSGLCLDSDKVKEKGLILNTCSDNYSQHWGFEVSL